MTKPTQANYQDLLKTIAIVAMIIDHLGLFIFQDTVILRVIGRMVMPIFCFFVGYNFTKPKILIAILGIILSLLNFVLWKLTMLNMLISIYCGQCVLYLARKYNFEKDENLWYLSLLMILFTPLTYEFFDYGTLGIAFMIVGRLYGLNKEDPGFILLLAASTMIFSLTLNFDQQNNIIAATLIAIVCYALTAKRYDRPISVDLRCISRHSLAIYFCHLTILSTLGYYLAIRRMLW
jgi:hypothetical protein